MKFSKCNECPHICECCENHGAHVCGDCYIKTHYEFAPKAHISFCPMDGERLVCDKKRNSPLTIEELIKMQDKAVWVQPKGDPLNGNWYVVECASVVDGNKFLYLWGQPFPYLIDEHHEAFTTRQMERR